MKKSIIRFILNDIFPPLTLLIVGSIMLFSPNATMSVQIISMFLNLGWIFIYGGLALIGLSLFERLTRCKLCKNDVKHTLPECVNERLFLRNVK